MLKLLSTSPEDSFWKYSRKKNPIGTHDFYPDAALRKLQLHAEFTPRGQEPVGIDLAPFYLCIDDEFHTTTLGRTLGLNRIAHTDRLVLNRGRKNILDLTYGHGKVTLTLNGRKFSFKSKYQPTVDKISIYWPSHCEIRQLKVWGQIDPTAAPPVRSKDYLWSVTVDFFDDLLPAPYTRRMLADLMKYYAELGVRRVYWITDGGRKSGYWDPAGNRFANDRHVKQTFDNLGDDDLKAAVDAGHRVGLEVYAVFKPFDMSIMGCNFPLGSDLAEKYGKNEVLGGKAYWCYNFVAAHPELCLRRRSLPSKTRTTIETIELASRNPVDFQNEIRIWVSDDNWKYRPYPTEYTVKRTRGKVTVSDLAIREKFLAVQVLEAAGQDKGKNRFYHLISKLVKVFDAKGRPVEFTYGLVPRSYPQYATDGEYLGHAKMIGGRFEEDGFFFDSFTYGIPSGVLCGEALDHVPIALDNDKGVIGLAVGKNKIVPGVMCPSEPKARKFWLDIIREALAAGVDGVDLRQMSHNNIIEWTQYGFNPPVVREFKRRYGVDVRREEFDPQAWRKLRGEYYTQFLEDAGNLIRAHRKKVQIHIEDIMEGTPDASTLREIHWDWETWLERGLADEVTMKALNIHTFRSHFGREVIRRCREKNIPVHFCHFIHRWGILGLKDWKDYLARQARNSGITGFNLYENAELIISQKNGSLKVVQPELLNYIRQLVK